MGFGKKRTAATPTKTGSGYNDTPAKSDPIPSDLHGPYPADNAKRMPLSGTQSQIAAARAKRREIIARSGRDSTRLNGNSGMMSFINRTLGSTN
jgi:hypothetical protein